MFDLNPWIIIMAAAVYFIIGFLAHGPVLGKLWMKLANIKPTGKEKMSDMYGQMFWNLVSNLVLATVMAKLMLLIDLSGFAINEWCTAWGAAMMIWVIGLTMTAMEPIWMGRKLSLWIFESLVTLVSLLAMATVLMM